MSLIPCFLLPSCRKDNKEHFDSLGKALKVLPHDPHFSHLFVWCSESLSSCFSVCLMHVNAFSQEEKVAAAFFKHLLDPIWGEINLQELPATQERKRLIFEGSGGSRGGGQADPVNHYLSFWCLVREEKKEPEEVKRLSKHFQKEFAEWCNLRSIDASQQASKLKDRLQELFLAGNTGENGKRVTEISPKTGVGKSRTQQPDNVYGRTIQWRKLMDYLISEGRFDTDALSVVDAESLQTSVAVVCGCELVCKRVA